MTLIDQIAWFLLGAGAIGVLMLVWAILMYVTPRPHRPTDPPVAHHQAWMDDPANKAYFALMVCAALLLSGYHFIYVARH